MPKSYWYYEILLNGSSIIPSVIASTTHVFPLYDVEKFLFNKFRDAIFSIQYKVIVEIDEVSYAYKMNQLESIMR